MSQYYDKSELKYCICNTSVALFIFSIITIFCWIAGVTTKRDGFVVSNHYSWEGGDDQYNIHYYCNVKYDNDQYCDKPIYAEDDSGRSYSRTKDSVEVRLNSYCAVNSTMPVYKGVYFNKACSFDDRHDLVNVGYAFLALSAIALMILCRTQYVYWHNYVRVENVQNNQQPIQMNKTHVIRQDGMIVQKFEMKTCEV